LSKFSTAKSYKATPNIITTKIKHVKEIIDADIDNNPMDNKQIGNKQICNEQNDK
jgi:hypothetical protein